MTYSNNDLARRLDTASNNGITIIIQVDGYDLSTSHIAPANLAIQNNSRVIEEPGNKLRDLSDILRSDHSLVQVMPQDLLDQTWVYGSFIYAEDPAALDDGCQSIVAGREESDILLGSEELGGIGDLAE